MIGEECYCSSPFNLIAMKNKAFWVKQLGESWAMKLKPLLKSPQMDKLIDKTMFDYIWHPMFPLEKKDIFKAFKECPFDSLRIVVIGTGPGVMTGTGGLAFSDSQSYNNFSATAIRNCLEKQQKELSLDFDFSFESWAHQGILMLNRSLTAYQTDPKSHKEEWELFFLAVLFLIDKEKPGTIFLLIGKEAAEYSELLSEHHHVFSWEHPLKARKEQRIWNCPHFDTINKLLTHHDRKSILWRTV
jgi:uracil-DNA glycosylase